MFLLSIPSLTALQFHFHATPHPLNVRRRIKQLKDYISVTSDWISYALIDDITDAFGPLIQSIEYEVDSIDELVLILKEAEQSDMLRRFVIFFFKKSYLLT
jgi:magnesium transporter